MEAPSRPVEILLAEDNLADVEIFERSLRDAPFPSHLTVVSDGEAALAFLQQQAPYTHAPTPDLILLDIYLPLKSGWEVLEWLKAQPELARIPVVMLTGILAPLDEQERDRLHPTRCLVKPTAVEEYRALVHALKEVMKQAATAFPTRARSMVEGGSDKPAGGRTMPPPTIGQRVVWNSPVPEERLRGRVSHIFFAADGVSMTGVVVKFDHLGPQQSVTAEIFTRSGVTDVAPGVQQGAELPFSLRDYEESFIEESH